MREAAKTVVRRTPETLTVVRYRTQPTAVTIARLSVTAMFAYGVALFVPYTSAQPVLAPLTALLVAQVTLYQTLRSAITRVAAVVAGVLVAVAVSKFVGFTWWSLGLTIVAALIIGYSLRPAVTNYVQLATTPSPAERQHAESGLREHLDKARYRQDRLSTVLAANPAGRPVGWPLRGELISHVDRLRSELEAAADPAVPEVGREHLLPSLLRRVAPRRSRR